MQKRIRQFTLITGILLPSSLTAVCMPANQQISAKAQFFSDRVLPLLQKRCLGCHGVGAKLGGLDLSSREAALKGGSHGPAFAPGNSSKSRLHLLVSGQRTPLMPPGEKLVAPEILPPFANGTPFNRHPYVKGPVPAAVTLNTAEPPKLLVTFCGWEVMAGSKIVKVAPALRSPLPKPLVTAQV